MTPTPRDRRPGEAESRNNDAAAAANARPTSGAGTSPARDQSARAPADSTAGAPERASPGAARPARAPGAKASTKGSAAKTTGEQSTAAKSTGAKPTARSATAKQASSPRAQESSTTGATSATSSRTATSTTSAGSGAATERGPDAQRPIEVRSDSMDSGKRSATRGGLTPSARAPDVVAGSAPAGAAAELGRRDAGGAVERAVDTVVHDEGAAAREQLLATYAAAADALREAVRGRTADELRAARLDDGASVAGVLAHLADSELHGLLRMRRIIAEPESVLQPYDDSRWLAALGDVTPPDAAIELFAALRRLGAELLRAATPAQRAQRCYHPEHGEVTLDLVLERHARHADRHIGRIREATERRE